MKGEAMQRSGSGSFNRTRTWADSIRVPTTGVPGSV